MVVLQAPRPGQTIPAFEAERASGGRWRSWDARGRRNLVLAFAGRAGGRDLLRRLAAIARAARAEDADLVAVLPEPAPRAAQVGAELGLSFETLADPEGRLHGRFGALDARGQPSPALFVTDRNGVIFARALAAAGEPLLAPEEVLDWLRFIQIQTPECEACFPAWPREP